MRDKQAKEVEMNWDSSSKLQTAQFSTSSQKRLAELIKMGTKSSYDKGNRSRNLRVWFYLASAGNIKLNQTASFKSFSSCFA